MPTGIRVPAYLTDQTEDAIRARLEERAIALVTPPVDLSEGSFLGDAYRVVAPELAQCAIWLQATLARGFVQTTGGRYLDLFADMFGLARRPAVTATGAVVVTGTVGAVVPAGTRVATPATPSVPAVVFATLQDATIPIGGVVSAPIAAVTPGAAGNVAPGAISLLLSGVAGVTAVANAAATADGVDVEADDVLRDRILFHVRNPSSSGNRADYHAWALEVAGVGAASVEGLADGPKTVRIHVVDAAGLPADQVLVDRVQLYVAPPHAAGVEAEAMTVALAPGVSTVDRADDTGTSERMAYDAAGPGRLTHQRLDLVLPRPGIWQARVTALQAGSVGATPVWEIGWWNLSAGAWCKVAPSSAVDAVRQLTAAQMLASFAAWTQDGYWNGADQIEFRISRLVADPAAVVDVDRVLYVSAFSKDDGSGRAPIGTRVTVVPATRLDVEMDAGVVIQQGYDHDAVRASLADQLGEYVRAVSRQLTDRVLYWTEVGRIIKATPGVKDYSGLLLNGATANIALAPNQVAVLTIVGLTTWDEFDAALVSWDRYDAEANTWDHLDGRV